MFATPIEPGNTVTIAIKPTQNPTQDGIYLFGLTAYPTGDNSQGMYLGSSRIYIGHD